MTSQDECPPGTGMSWFARHVLGRPLYPYQEIIGDAILDSVVNNRGYTITVMLARQMGKNQLSAILEAYLLFAFEQGSIIKAAPTFRPQIGHSHQRLLQMLAPLRSRLWKSSGSVIGLAPTSQQTEARVGPYVHFLSAGPESNIVGATASLLLEIDEAQAVTTHKYDVELKPMASTTQATTVLYGTAWSDDTLLARIRAYNLELEQQDGIRRHFEFDWTHLAVLNKRYKNFVESEIARLGEDHLSIRTQYRLQPVRGANSLLNDLQRSLIAGTHLWQSEPGDECYYIAGLDIGGEERPDLTSPNVEAMGANQGTGMHRGSKRDSTVLTIGRVASNEFGLPFIEIVHQYWWTGMGYLEQYAALCELAERWNLRRLIVDQTGLGAMLASLLMKKLGVARVIPFHFTRSAKSALTYHFLGMINTGRLKLYVPGSSPPEIFEECWKQLSQARYALPGGEQMTMHVDPGDGHDDFLMSIALCCEAVKELTPPDFTSVWIRPRPSYTDGPY